MQNYKDILKKIMFCLKLRDTLPARIVNKVHIKDNNERLIDLKTDGTFFFGDELQKREAVYLRETVYKKLCKARNYLPENYCFKIYSAFRSQQEQQMLWDEKYKQMKSKYPDLPEEQLIFRVKSVCADPRFGFGGHQTGGAVDISLCNPDGIDYPMGTKWAEVNKKTKTKSKFLSDEEHKNRFILVNVMKKVGFVNYPPEWWHYCYGDRMWAAYTCKNSCIYGKAEL